MRETAESSLDAQSDLTNIDNIVQIDYYRSCVLAGNSMKSEAMKGTSPVASLTDSERCKDIVVDKDVNLLIEKYQAENSLDRISKQIKNLN